MATIASAHIDGAGGVTVVKSGAGFLYRVTVNAMTTGAYTLTLYDNTAASGLILAVIKITRSSGNDVSPFSLEYGLSFATGLTVNYTGAANGDATLVYS